MPSAADLPGAGLPRVGLPSPELPGRGPEAEFVLTLSCPDRPGIVHAVAAYLHESGCNILDSQQFADRIAARFFMRVHVETAAADGGAALRAGFGPVAAPFGWNGNCTTWRSGRGC